MARRRSELGDEPVEGLDDSEMEGSTTEEAPPLEEVQEYTVGAAPEGENQPPFYVIKGDSYKPGDTVELTESEANLLRHQGVPI